MTPSILPDNTIRLQIDGTVATQVGTVAAPTGSNTAPNVYPIVNEAHLVNLSRVPSGYSLILGGFVTINNSISTNKVPVLGSIPLLGQAFRFKSSYAFAHEPGIYHYAHRIPSREPRAIGRGQRIRPEDNNWSGT